MKINKILQERAFRQKTITDGGQILTSAERSMYYAILQIVDDKACGNNWADYLPISVRQLMREAALSSKTVITARKRLIELGLITVKPPKNSRASMEYRIVKLYDEKPTTQNQPQPTKDKQAAENQEIVEALAAIEGDAVGTWQVMTDEKGVFHLDKRDAAGLLQVLGVQVCIGYMEQAQGKRSPGAWLYKVLMTEASKARENNKIAAAALELKRKQQEEAQAQQAAALQQAAGDGDIYSFSMK